MYPIRPQFRLCCIASSVSSSAQKENLLSVLPTSFPGQTSNPNQYVGDDAGDASNLDSTLSKYTKCTQDSHSDIFDDLDAQFFAIGTALKSKRKQLKKEMKKQKIKRKQQEKINLNLEKFQNGPFKKQPSTNQSVPMNNTRSEKKNLENSVVAESLNSQIQKLTQLAFANPVPHKKLHTENGPAASKSHLPFLSLLQLDEVKALLQKSQDSDNKQNLFPEQTRIIQQNSLQYSHFQTISDENYFIADLRNEIRSKPSKKSNKFHRNSKLSFIQNLIDHSQKYQLPIQNAKPHDSHVQKIHLQRKNSDNGKKTLLIDLDDTLIFTSNPINPSQLSQNDLKISQNDGKVRKLYLRPYAKQFLERMNRYYEIIIFTAATKCYAEQIRKILDPTDSIISHLLDRQFCFNPNKGLSDREKLPYIKDLRKLDRDLSQTILLDNSIYCFWYQISNGIPIVSYNKERRSDTELLKVQKYLVKLIDESDVRKKNREYFKLQKYEEHVDARTLVEELYMNLDDEN